MDLILQNLPNFLIGARNTLIYCVVSFPLALLIGLILALMKSSPFAWINMPAKIFIEVVRSTPIITQLFLVYYGLGAVLANYNLAYLLNSWVAGITVLALNYAAYEAEVDCQNGRAQQDSRRFSIKAPNDVSNADKGNASPQQAQRPQGEDTKSENLTPGG